MKLQPTLSLKSPTNGAKTRLNQLTNKPAMANNTNKKYLKKRKKLNLYQSMLADLLSIDGYNESVVALGANIPLSAIKSIKSGLIRNPSTDTLGKLLRFYNSILASETYA